MKPNLIVPVFEPCFCVKCDFNTSGTIDTQTKIRHCQVCKSLFINCPACKKNISTTERFGVIVCDGCKTEFSAEPVKLEKIDSANEVVLSGMRATGKMHFGNFLGAVRHFSSYQKPGNICMYFIADLHTLTTSPDPGSLQKNLMEIATDYLAAGLDPEQSIIYVQSSVPEILELATCLSMLQPMGELERIPTFKELVRKNPDNVNLGLLSYPVLMAADILAPRATIVPVGADQIPNVELAKVLARRFNERYGNILKVPKFPEEMIRVPGLNGEKMGKSESEHAISVSGTQSEILERYLRLGITDIRRKTVRDPGDPYACKSVFPIHRILDQTGADNIAEMCRNATIGCVDCKKSLVSKIMPLLEPFQENRRRFEKDQDYVRDVLHFGGIKARSRVRETVDQVRSYMGIERY